MPPVRFLLTLVFFINVIALVSATSAIANTHTTSAYYYAGPVNLANNEESLLNDGTAASTACRFAADIRVCRLDAAALEALRKLHAALDDDKDGKVDAAELDGFAREELSQVHDFDREYADSRNLPSSHQSSSKETIEELFFSSGTFPRSDKVSSGGGGRGGKGKALDLWHAWRASEMHNWTVDEVCKWLSFHASLGQLAPLARHFNIDGPHLPLLTDPNSHPAVAPLAQALNATERRKLAIRATDLVLFGSPAKAHNLLKDFLIAVFLFSSLGLIWVILTQMRLTDGHRRRVFDELVSLQNAEKSLGDLQNKLTKSEQQREHDRAERLRLQDVYQREIDNLKAEAGRLSSQRLNTTETDLAERLRLAEQEVAQLRAALETESQRRPASAAVSPELWALLQQTWESELRYCRQNWQQAELRLAKASEGLERLRRKQNSVLGVLRGAFNSAEMVGSFELSIAEAKAFADKVKLDVSERMQRWSRIEELLGLELQQQVRTAAPTSQQRLEVVNHQQQSAVGGSTLRHRGNQFHRRNLSHDATAPTYLAGAAALSSVALRSLDQELELNQAAKLGSNRQLARRKSSALAADVPGACIASWPRSSAVGVLLAASGGDASRQPGPSASSVAAGTAALDPDDCDFADSAGGACDGGSRADQLGLGAVAQFHVPEDDVTDSAESPANPQPHRQAAASLDRAHSRSRGRPISWNSTAAEQSPSNSTTLAAAESPAAAAAAAAPHRQSSSTAKSVKLRALSIFFGKAKHKKRKSTNLQD